MLSPALISGNHQAQGSTSEWSLVVAPSPCRFRFKREQETDKYTFDVTLLRGRAKSAGGSAPPLPPVPAVIVGGSNGLQNDYARGNKYGGHAEQAAASAWTPGPVPLGGGSENGLREEMTKLRGAEEAMKEEIALLKAAEVTLRGEVTSAKMAEATLKGEVASVEMSETAVKNELASAKEAVEEAQRARRELEEQLSMAQSNMGKGQAELARAQAELGRLKEDSLQMEKVKILNPNSCACPPCIRGKDEAASLKRRGCLLEKTRLPRCLLGGILAVCGVGGGARGGVLSWSSPELQRWRN